MAKQPEDTTIISRVQVFIRRAWRWAIAPPKWATDMQKVFDEFNEENRQLIARWDQDIADLKGGLRHDKRD